MEECLKPCPFCNSEAKIIERPNGLFVVSCFDNVLCRGWECTDKKCTECKDGYVYKQEAIDKWNTRPTAGKMAALDEDSLYNFLLSLGGDLQFAYIYKRQGNDPARDVSKAICQRFSSPEVTVEELETLLMEHILDKGHMEWTFQSLAQAIHQRLNQRRE